MKESKGKTKRTSEEWVSVAKDFGEKYNKIQQDPKLSMDQKLEKQTALVKQVIVEIENDTFVSNEAKKKMLKSIESYIEGSATMNASGKGAAKRENNPLLIGC